MDPKFADAQKALSEGRKLDAVELLKTYLQAKAGAAQVHAVLLNLLLELGQHDEGALWSERAVRAAPKDYALLNLHGAFLRLAGRYREALQTFDRAIKFRPGEIAARANKGHVYNDLKDGKAAEQIFATLVRQHPRIGELQRALGVALQTQGKNGEAERRFRSALALNPRDIDAWLDLSAALAEQSDMPAALAALDEGLARIPGQVRLLKAKAVLLRHAGREGEGASLLRTIMSSREDIAWVHHELARCIANEEPRMSIRHHRRAIDLAPSNIEYRLFFADHVLRHLANCEAADIDDAYRLLTACPPPQKDNAIGTKVWTQWLTRCGDFDRSREIGSLRDLGRLWVADNMHSALLDQFSRVESRSDRLELIHQHLSWGDGAIQRAKRNAVVHPAEPRSSAKLRIGFMSSDLRQHVVSYFAWPLFEHYDRSRFELYAYSFYRGDKDALQRRISGTIDTFRWEPSLDARSAAQLIADDQLDILFELGGSTYMNKLEVMAWKPAPICASWLGYPHSAGLTTIDYLMVDPFLASPDPALMVEKPLMMPRSWIAMSELAFPERLSITPELPARRNGFISFGTANSSYKYNPTMLRTWARAMARTPGSRFIFVRPECGSAAFRRNIAARFQAEGIAEDRLEFRAVSRAHMEHYNDIDIALDTFPQTGGTTTCEALWMGVPTVTLVGEALFERLSYSILNNAGLGDLCAATPEQFVDIAAALAADTERLQALRIGLRERIRAGPLGQTRQFAEDFYDLITRTVTDGHSASGGG